MFEKDRQNILDIGESIDKIIKYTENINNLEDFENNSLVVDAALMNIVAIGESVARLSKDFRNDNKNIEWTKIKALRNIIAHNYFGIDIEEIWEIVKIKIVELDIQIKKINIK
ncbi:MAG TPA: DUF86 domain-containing protein [Spirochaetota bacterium]|jgi:uncharacterized protein with HEPN domain|nr:MAG: hypothetical protein BWX91_02453 [Spirochaetes bacterium ADurb.Bin133]HPY88678.1 DUF86 domain-containing protein [Spirochaetota bacterium]HQB61687.1 DUF86 domain-containing protein [Spirochaetota bacterium]